MTGWEGAGRWRVSLVGQAPDNVPGQWVTGLAAVTRDLRCRRYGRTVSIEAVEWELTVTSEGWVAIGLAKLTDASDLSPFAICQSYTLETTPAQAMVWTAEAIQDELAGYEFVLWPSDGRRLLTPEIRAGEAVWIDSSTDSVVSRIGALCEARHSV
jgi:hypothetical protein